MFVILSKDTIVLWNTSWSKWYRKILYNDDISMVFMNYSTGRHEYKLKHKEQKHFLYYSNPNEPFSGLYVDTWAA